MKNDLLSSDNIYDAVSGHFLSAAHQNLAEVINLYNPSLFVVWIPPTERVKQGPKPFGIAVMQEGQEPYVFMLLSEIEMNDPNRIMAMIIQADGAKGANVTSFLQSEEDARMLLDAKKQLEQRAEMHDRAHSMFFSPLHSYQVEKGRKVNL